MYKGETPIWFDDDGDGGDNELSVMGDEFPDGAKDAGPTSQWEWQWRLGHMWLF